MTTWLFFVTKQELVFMTNVYNCNFHSQMHFYEYSCYNSIVIGSKILSSEICNIQKSLFCNFEFEIGVPYSRLTLVVPFFEATNISPIYHKWGVPCRYVKLYTKSRMKKNDQLGIICLLLRISCQEWAYCTVWQILTKILFHSDT